MRTGHRPGRCRRGPGTPGRNDLRRILDRGEHSNHINILKKALPLLELSCKALPALGTRGQGAAVA
ncbi:Uncharacterised protein [Bordetella pertussis]|nr:Uncharacterised protein [Bordetella pertussis]